MRFRSNFVGALLALTPFATPLNATQIATLIDEAGLTAGTPTIDVAVATSAELCYEGRFVRGAGVTPTTAEEDKLPRFHSASISKLFTATAIMQLRDEGKLALDDRVGEYIPAFTQHDIRLKHLLTHTSGLRDRKRANGRSTRKDVDAYINALAKQRKSQTPGEVWRYADAGFNLLGRVIQEVTGEPFANEMRDRLLKPLGMKSSSFDLAQIPLELRVTGRSKRGRPLQHPWDLAFLPSSGLQTTARDLARFAQAVLRVQPHTANPELLRFETLQEMTTVRIATKWSGVDQGYGWQLINAGAEPVWRHAGGEGGLESLLAIYPKVGNAIVAIGNQKDWPRFQLVSQIRAAIVGATTGSCVPAQP